MQTGGNGWFLICRLREHLSAGPPGSTTLNADHSSAGQLRDVSITAAAMEVLADMMYRIVEAAAAQDDYRVVWVALQLALRISSPCGESNMCQVWPACAVAPCWLARVQMVT